MIKECSVLEIMTRVKSNSTLNSNQKPSHDQKESGDKPIAKIRTSVELTVESPASEAEQEPDGHIYSSPATTRTNTSTSTDLDVPNSTPQSPQLQLQNTMSANRFNGMQKYKRSHLFLDLMTKSTIIVIIFCAQPIIIDLFWYIHHYGYVSILIPMNLVSLNMVIDAFCILLFNKFGENYYDYICKCNNKENGSKIGCHFCCQGCCKATAKLF